jgi:hypothetical protein
LSLVARLAGSDGLGSGWRLLAAGNGILDALQELGVG